MTASYNNNLLTALDRIRFTLGDTNVDPAENALKPDEEYLAVIDGADSEAEATALMAEALATQVMQDPDSYSESGGISVSWSSRIKTWLAIAESYRARANVAASTYGQTVFRRPKRDPDFDPEYRRPYSRWRFDSI